MTLPISKETFVSESDPRQQRALQWDILEYISLNQAACRRQCDAEIRKLKRRKTIDRVWAIASGIGTAIGGALAAIWTYYNMVKPGQ